MADKDFLVIAHRGASGYVPEHTLEAKAYAHALGADYIEQDVVATRDNELVVLHDIFLDRVTDVADRFTGRHREDGRYYVRDFDLAEIRTLNVHERRRSDGVTAVFPNRFPTGVGRFRVSTLREEIRFIQGMNQSTGRVMGIYSEIKKPAFHREDGVDISPMVLQLLDDLGYHTKSDPVIVECFDARETRRIRHELGCQLKLAQLIEDNEARESDTDYDQLRTPEGLADIARTVDAIGPKLTHVVKLADVDGMLVSTGLVSMAHDLGLLVHPWTFRADQLAPGFDSLQEMIRWFVDEIRIDGVFTDFPDMALEAIRT
jgi:glycerophosphoryl diester phosphodiesterase